MMKALVRLAAVLVGAAGTACTNDPLLVLQETTETTLGPSGGEAVSADGKLKLSFALGALAEETIIEIETIRNGDAVLRAPENIRWELSPHGLQFDRDVFISITAEPASPNDELAIANVDGAYPVILESSVWDRENKFARASLRHFSAYTAVAVYNPCGNLGCGDPCVICDPLNSSCTEPPGVRACNRSGLCVDETVVTCPIGPDAGALDTGLMDSGEPDSGEVDDGGVEDSGVHICSDTFTQNVQPIVDILVVMDNSGSMFDEQLNLASSFDLLRDTLVNNNADFHLGVTSTDVTTDAGALLGTPAVLTSSTPSLEQAFAMNISLGVNGSTFEAGLEASQLALTAPANPGFLRDTGSLAVIYLSDEDDQSVSSTTAYTNFLINLRGERRVQANAIVGTAPDGCTGPNGLAAAGPRYDAVRLATGGAFDSICNAHWGSALTDLGGPGFGYLYRFTLAAPAASVSTVLVDGAPVPASDWSYDAATQTIEFTESAVPGPGAVIEVVSDCS